MMENGKQALLTEDGLLVAEIRVSYNPRIPMVQLPIITKSEDIYQLALSTWDTSTIQLYEQMKVMMINSAGRVLGILPLSSGGMNTVVCDPKMVFMATLKTCASSIVLIHNHPAGSLYPSMQDKNVTQKIKEAGKYLDIQLLDHLIITPDGYYSFADGGLI